MGARRASDGHPSPFPLRYVEIGNENWGPEYDRRFDLFYQAIKEKYPQLTLIYNEMPQREGASTIAKTDMIDPHYYVDPYYFFRNTTLFDEWERGKYTIYVGEYACNRNVGGGNMLGALSEAAFIGGMERNGDLVRMASYAPLFENRHDRSWATNLIWIDTDQVVGRSSYYVQKMAAENRPTYNVESTPRMHAVDPDVFGKGHIGFGASSARVEFKDIKIESPDGVQTLPDTVLREKTQFFTSGTYGDRYTLSFRARKTEGTQGFQCLIGMDAEGKTGYRYNIGMWSSNDRAEIVQLKEGRDLGILAEHSGKTIETGKWYAVRINVSPEKSELYIDGKLLLSAVSRPMPLQFVHSGYDENTGEVVMKVVNASDEPYHTSISLKGALDIAKAGTVITLNAPDGRAENSYEEPRAIYPHQTEYNGFGERFDYDFQPFSYTILRIKARPAGQVSN